MRYLDVVFEKIYYSFWNIILPRESIDMPEEIKKTKNIFLYFDFESGFSGYHKKVKRDDILFLLNLLNRYNIQCTWFTVGKIFEENPEYIDLLLNEGHEIGSHTFNHLTMLKASRKKVTSDFEQYQRISIDRFEMTGFHSPRGRWSYTLLNSLYKYKYQYHIVGREKETPSHPYCINVAPGIKILCMHTLGDDWPVFRDHLNKHECINYFKKLFGKPGLGEIAGIGFHPWILFSDKNKLHCFEKFLDYIVSIDQVRIENALSYLKAIKPWQLDGAK